MREAPLAETALATLRWASMHPGDFFGYRYKSFNALVGTQEIA